jgi:hypothetical protein
MRKHAQCYSRPTMIVVLAALVLCAYPPLLARAQPSPAPCKTLNSQTVTSPDGAWKAVTSEYVCDEGYSFLTTAEYDVTFVSSSNPSITVDVFAVDDIGPPTRPLVTWKSSTSLNINTVHTNGLTNLQMTSYSGININYTYRKANSSLPTSSP